MLPILRLSPWAFALLTYMASVLRPEFFFSTEVWRVVSRVFLNVWFRICCFFVRRLSPTPVRMHPFCLQSAVRMG